MLMSIILKSKKKKFKIRRKHFVWVKKTEEKQKVILIKKMYNAIWDNILDNNKFKSQILPHLLNTFSNYFIFFKKIDNNNIRIYVNYLVKLDKTTRVFLKKEFNLSQNDFIVNAFPKKQPYFVIHTSNPIHIFSAGIMRRVLNLEDKSAKKKKLVFSNCVKYIYKFANIVLKNLFFIKIKKNLINLNLILKSNYLNKNKVTHILYEPKVSFDSQNVKKRSAVKKKLRKKKKYSEDI